jgi:hypothetical protein
LPVRQIGGVCLAPSPAELKLPSQTGEHADFGLIEQISAKATRFFKPSGEKYTQNMD